MEAKGVPANETSPVSDENPPRKMTFGENVVLTIKVLAGFGVLGAVLWAVSVWKAAN